ncbi:electron transfer flavoprotein subunit beta/FixA family protein [Nesterenkonia flava]|uniref:Electron transfer flavoprotein subunit beta n=1 Tax=Nesterenkonia flava TaxID=469799 RepID=A0ABU1FT72_9MICC|nr:electron transfer flavoprotein subunit beta/FixA family protein [Nesterenkonia flava]MDR5711527.1 electron transfer flavoprotein subunit beta/FixA family protein [Nesterenkonia flava]
MPALHIITLVKWVPDAQLERRYNDQQRLDRSEGILGELDEYPLEAALQIKEALQAQDADAQVRVSALTMGPAGASAAVKKALQIGADDGHHLTDEALIGADLYASSAALAAAVQHVLDTAEFADDAQHLILTGMASEDGESGALPAQLAERLGLPALTQATSLSLQDQTLTVTRLAGDRAQRIAAPLPAVVSVTDQANDPRYPNFKAIMAAKKKPVATFSLTDLGLSATAVEARLSMVSAEPRPERMAGEIITDDGDAGTRVVEFLAKERLL